jgi:hypothetical protein
MESVDDQFDHVSLWDMHVHQFFHLHGEVALGAVCCDVDVPPVMS